MKKAATIIFLASLALFFNACGKGPKPVAMDYYYPNGEKEVVSGIEAEITPAMIEQMKNRKKIAAVK